jgi:Fe-S-cluster-containing hydrogenase component 2
MAIRRIIEIDEEKCDGCGECVPACAEGAIQIIDGKAKVVSETYCDGLGACLGDCPQGAISIVEREAADFNKEAVKKHLEKLNEKKGEPLPMTEPLACGCPGSAMKQFNQSESVRPAEANPNLKSQLRHWPIQLMLVPPHAPFLKDADILVCADCVPFTVPDFHSKYLAGRALIVGCPKLDNLQFYFEKLKEIIKEAAPRKLTVLKMEVPCCSGIAQVVVKARNEVAPEIPVEVHTLSIQGGDCCEEIPAGYAA